MDAKGFTPWPLEERVRFERLGLWTGENLFDALSQRARLETSATALVDHRSSLSYGELIAAAERLAGSLTALGLKAGDRVMMHLPNCNEFVITSLACWRVGLKPVMALPAHREHELAWLCEFSRVRAYIAAETFRDFDYAELGNTLQTSSESLEHVLLTTSFSASSTKRGELDIAIESGVAPQTEMPDAANVALYLLSGGTTGLPKLIPRTHNDYLYNARCAAEVSAFDSNTRYLVALPAAHNFPLACPGILGTLLAGGQVVMAPSPRPEEAFELMREFGVTVTAAVPAVVLSWMEFAQHAGEVPKDLAVLQVGGSVFAPEAAARVGEVLGCTLQQVFGMAEGLINYTRLDDPTEAIIHTQGRPMSAHDEIRVVDEEGAVVDAGQSGELLTRGPYTLRGYFNAPEHNQRSFTADGFYRTGDIVRLREDGNLVVEGRSKDLINRGGEKISAEEIENLVLAQDAVFNAAAVAMPDEKLGERIGLYVVLHPGRQLTLEALNEFLKSRQIASFKLPEKLVCVDELPLTKLGKVDKKALREEIVRRTQED